MSLPITNGLVGWYKGEAWNGTSWPDLSGNGNDCTETRGTVRKTFDYIYGGTGDGIRFPVGILPSTYTLFHVTRYNGSIKGRIFDGTAGNWLSGFHGNKTGVAYHGYWLTQASATNFPRDEILITADQRNLYRGNGIDLKINSGTSQSQRIGINYGSRYGNEPSDWAVWEVIVYDRELSLEEIESIENYLFNRHLKNDIVHRGKNLFQPRDVAFYRIPSEYQNVNQMTDDTTNIPGFGNVVASVSSLQELYRNAAKAFNGEIVSNDGWRSAVEYSNGTYTGSASLGGYSGEWIKIQFPKPLFLYNSRIHARPTFIERLTKTGHIIASNDDINWVKIADIIRNDGVDSFYTNTSYLTTPYCFYAIVSTSIESTETTVNIGEWFLYTRKIEYNPIDINDGLQVHLDATVGVSYPGSGDTWYDISGNGNHFIINASAYQTTYMDFQGSYGIAKRVVNGALSDIGPYPEATIVCVCELLETTSTWRTLIRGASSDHQVIVRQSDSLMGMYANGRGNFYSSGFNIQNLPSGYNVLVWKLSQSSPYYQFTYNDTGVYYNITNENTSFINGFCCIGGLHNGNIDVNTASQYFGKIKNFMLYNRFLNTSEIQSLYNRFRV